MQFFNQLKLYIPLTALELNTFHQPIMELKSLHFGIEIQFVVICSKIGYMNHTPILRRTRTYLPDDFVIQSWETLKNFFEELLNREINSLQSLKIWLTNRSELETAISEEMGWRYIRMTCYTDNEAYREAFNYMITEIEPQIAPISNKLDEKILNSAYKNELNYSGDKILLRALETNYKIFREENISIFTEIQTLQQQYGAICGAMSVVINGQEITLQQAGVLLQSVDRHEREVTYKTINERRLKDKPQLDELYTKLISLRQQIAKNAGFDNFRDYMFVALGRYDYNAQDCFDFHAAIALEVKPLLNDFASSRKATLQLNTLRPWDLAVDPENKPPLKPFIDGEDLLEKTIKCFNKLDPFLAECLVIMKNMKHLDLESRKGKAPGGYNYPLDEIGIPFIFMNAAGTLQDTITMLHEGGHAVHSILTKPLALNSYRSLTSEIAELASMSMELISMAHWDVFFTDAETLKRAKKSHLEHVIETLPWVATIDKFQHWVYENPQHNLAERTQAWNQVHSEFACDLVDWSGLQEFKDNVWQKQLHLYEVPFYYIEYGIAQLGAIAVWKNCQENPQEGLKKYLEALKLGYTVSIKEVYATAGVKFDFSIEHIQDLMKFVKAELDKLD